MHKSSPQKNTSTDKASQQRSQHYLQQALGRHRAGQQQLAADAYQQAIKSDQRNADAWNLLGVLRYQQRDLLLAEELFRQALQLRAAFADADFNLASLLRETQRLPEALTHYSAAVAARPDFFQAHDSCGLVLQELGRYQEAIAAHRRAFALVPSNPLVANNLAVALKAAGQISEAIEAYRTALQMAPKHLEARLNLGNLLLQARRIAEGLAELRQALHLHPDHPLALLHCARALIAADQRGEARALLGAARAQGLASLELIVLYAEQCLEGGDNEAALEVLEPAAAANPQSKALWFTLGLAQLRRGRYDQALAIFERLLSQYPDDVDVRVQLAWLLPAFGRGAESSAHLQQVLALLPENRQVFSAYLLAMNYEDHFSAAEIFNQHKSYAERHSQACLPALRSVRQSRLRIAYVSNAFCRNALASFIGNVLCGHRRADFEVVCYRTGGGNDDVTALLRSQADRWVDCAERTDQELAEQIAADGIDILIDLMGHTADNRLGVFARRPAPVQVTWLGYLNTSGLPEMDYRLTDRVADPASVAAALHTEKLAYLPDTQWCFKPPVQTPPVLSLPALVNGFVTFGSFNAFHKLSPTCLQLYADVLLAVPDSRLMICDIAPGGPAQYLSGVFEARGVAKDRLILLPRATIDVFYQKRGEVDIALDSHPYSGGTTTCESLWMGVPVVTLTGDSTPSRSSASLLTACGLERLVAANRIDYCRIALELASDLAALNALRLGLRERLQASAIMDIDRFVRGLESTYQDMWRAVLQ